jgi:nucleotide-binding universal stress UspA family protein
MVTIDHVICPVDLSTPSASALLHAAAWARWYQVPLRVLYVSTPPQVLADGSGQTIVFAAPPIDEVRREVARFICATLPDEPLPPIDIVEGHPDSVIVDTMTRWPQALLVMGTHGRTGLQHVLIGSVAERVAHTTSNPLLIVPPHDATSPQAAIELKHILCAVDFRPSSLAALRHALSLASLGRQRLDLVTVTDAPRAGEEGSLDEERERRAAMLDAFRDHVPDDVRRWCVIHEEVLRGAPADALLTYAGDVGADLIVMGAGDHGWLHMLWLGSTTARVMRGAACPVLIVPAPDRPALEATTPSRETKGTPSSNAA